MNITRVDQQTNFKGAYIRFGDRFRWIKLEKEGAKKITQAELSLELRRAKSKTELSLFSNNASKHNRGDYFASRINLIGLPVLLTDNEAKTYGKFTKAKQKMEFLNELFQDLHLHLYDLTRDCKMDF
jgi:hypothetical protein